MRARRVLAVCLVLFAAVAGGLAALWAYSDEKRLSAGTVELSVSPFHRGSLDVYVPLVDWGVRFGGVRMPARLHLDVRTVDRKVAAEVAGGGELPVQRLKREAANRIASFLRVLALVVAATALLAGGLAALALRRPRLIAVAGGVGVLWALAIAFLLPPRGALGNAEYYARGADIPVALRAVESASQSGQRLGEEVDSQLVGLARLVEKPGERPSLRGLPRFTVASDMHNNIVVIPTIRRAAAGGPVLFPGDLTDSGTPLEASVTRRVVAAGHPLVVTGGNHDSDTLERQLARRGAIVLTQNGQVLPGRRHGRVVVRVAGVRIAGYRSPNERRRSDGYADRGADITKEQQADFLGWLLPLIGKVDVVMVHEPALVEPALRYLRSDPPDSPILFVVGHTHRQAVDARNRAALVNGGTVGAGGTGNLTEGQVIGLAVVTFSRFPFNAEAVDLIRVDPGTGAAKAQRVRIGANPVTVGEPNARSPETKR